jgi:hypothetical protein
MKQTSLTLKNSLITAGISATLALTANIKPVQAVNFNFATSNSGFTPTANGTSGFTYTGGTGWRTPGQSSVQGNSLTGPTLFVQANGTVSISLTHRYNFENRWDGGQLRYSVNGGAFTTQTAFTANGYSATLNGSGNPIAGQQAWTNQSAGYSTPSYITSTANLGTFNLGDQINMQFFAGWDSSGVNPSPNWEINGLTVNNAELTPAAAVPFDFHAAPGLVIVGLGGAVMSFKKWLRQKKSKL